jgi:hypothetical protein
MENISNIQSQSQIQSSQENTMGNHDTQNFIVQIFNDFIQNGGEPKVTSFKRHLDSLINADIKPLCSRSAKSPDGSDWRSVLKSKFSGRGAKWVQISVDELSETLNNFDSQDIDTKAYRMFIEQAGFAWIRFSGPRINSNIQSAAFEVRTPGSTIDCPKQLHYVPVSQIDELIKPLNGTPHSLKLEVLKSNESQENSEEPVAEELCEDTEFPGDEAHEMIDEVIKLDSLDEIYNDFMEDECNDEIFANA